MENKLFDAATQGNLDELRLIISNDRFILEKIVAGCFSWSPLHVAASHGHASFVAELLRLNLELAQVLDSQNRSALHIAAAKGHIDVVNLFLIKLGSNICLTRDQNGHAPLHVAAINGKVQVVKELLQGNLNVARMRMDRDETILHLCVKHHQFEVLELLLATIKDKEFINAKDDCGNTILHMAVYIKQLQVIEFVLCYSRIEVNEKNLLGKTALDILFMLKTTTKDAELEELQSIENIILRAFGRRGTQVGTYEWLERRDVLMVAASVIVATSFQAAVNPPGGFWQENLDNHKAGEAIMATLSPQLYSFILLGNSMTFLLSASLMILLSCAYQIPKLAMVICLVPVSCFTLLTMASTFACSISAITPGKSLWFHERERGTHKKSFLTPLFSNNIAIAYFIYIFGLIYLTLLGKLVYEFNNLLKKIVHDKKLLAKVVRDSPNTYEEQGVVPIEAQ